MKHIEIINGPNLNLTGRREPSIYGRTTMEEMVRGLKQQFPDVEIGYYQSNSEQRRGRAHQPPPCRWLHRRRHYPQRWRLQPHQCGHPRCHCRHHHAGHRSAHQQHLRPRGIPPPLAPQRCVQGGNMRSRLGRLPLCR